MWIPGKFVRRRCAPLPHLGSRKRVAVVDDAAIRVSSGVRADCIVELRCQQILRRCVVAGNHWKVACIVQRVYARGDSPTRLGLDKQEA